MPLYTLQCPVCSYEEEVLCKFDERTEDEDIHGVWAVVVGQSAVYYCPHDQERLVWKGAELPQTADYNGNRSGRFQMKAIASSGQKVAGHFGKTAKRERKS